MPLEALGEELFLTSRVYRCFSVNLLLCFRSDRSSCIFIAVRSHSFSTDFIYSGFRVQF